MYKIIQSTVYLYVLSNFTSLGTGRHTQEAEPGKVLTHSQGEPIETTT